MGPEVIFKYFEGLSEIQKKQMGQLGPLYTQWNEKINVISRKDIDLLYERHVLHSLAIARYIDFEPGAQILDVGTGGGFPGIPLAILFPKCTFHLVDSIAKKIGVVEAIAQSLQLPNVTATHQRAEKVKGAYDYIVSRAVAKAKQVVQWTHPLLKKNEENLQSGWILLKGGDLTKELAEYGRLHTQIPITNYFKEDFFETKKIVFLPKN